MIQARADRDKAGALLAWLVNSEKWGSVIVELETNGGEHLYSQAAINQHFCDYYQTLYSSSKTDNIDLTRELLDPLQLTTLLPEDEEILGGDITLTEVMEAIQSTAKRKTPGTDGIPAEFYATYSDILAPKMVELFTSAGELGQLP